MFAVQHVALRPVSQTYVSEHLEAGHKCNPDQSVWTSPSWLHLGSLKITVFSKLGLVQIRQGRVNRYGWPQTVRRHRSLTQASQQHPEQLRAAALGGSRHDC